MLSTRNMDYLPLAFSLKLSHRIFNISKNTAYSTVLTPKLQDKLAGNRIIIEKVLFIGQLENKYDVQLKRQ